ncbi:MAG: hypothetical protein HY367_00645 [Candidatus Aenigmarchaeota archaeon]|nr:hypothetical protein [Candidatus Aenigmarchaeota archaeon]
MVLEQIIGLINAVQDNTVLLIVLIVVLMVVAYKIFQTMMRVAITAVLFALIPVVGRLAGFPIELSAQNVLWFGLMGVLFYFIYSFFSFIAKVLGLVSKPFRGQKVKTVVVKEKVVEKEKKDKEKGEGEEKRKDKA